MRKDTEFAGHETMTEFTNDSLSAIKAIETEYKGYRFRSRLEARWAVFFETAGIEWKYEPEGFTCEGYEGQSVNYLPDFYLPKSETWVEIKGSNSALKKDSYKLERILDYNSPIPGIKDSYLHTHVPFITHGLVFLGDIPEPKWGPTLHPIIQHHKGLIWSWCIFSKWGVAVLDNDDRILNHFTEGPKDWCITHFHIDSPRGNLVIYEAYKAARAARFEFGETP